MAPSQSPQMKIGRKRARPATPQGRTLLRDEVLELIRNTKQPTVAKQQRLESQYEAAWAKFCIKISQADDEDDSDVAFHHAWKRLALAISIEDTSKEYAAMKIARSVCVSCGSGGARHLRLLLRWTWRGHTNSGGSLWRLEDVLQGVASIASENAVYHWLGISLRSLSSSAGSPTSRSVSQSIIAHLIRIAFTTPAASPMGNDSSRIDAATLTDEATQVSSINVTSLAREALVHLCSPPKDHSPATVLALVSDSVATFLVDYSQDEAVTAELQAFLRSQVKRLLVDVALSSTGHGEPPGNCGWDHILATFQSCVSPSNAVQLFRQVWTEATATTSSSGLSPIELLTPLLASCARRDASFQSHALAAAHDLAHDAITASSTVQLRQCLELAAAVTMVESDEASDESSYHEWFRGHFAALDAQSSSALSGVSDKSRLSITSSPGTSIAGCLRARASTPTSGGVVSVPVACSLVSTKRHLEFVCAFLMEYDRVESAKRRAYHVLAHLSAIKTHQTLSGSAVAGLLSDFCSQTRARYAELQAKEQASRARFRRRSSSSAISMKPSTSSTSAMSQASPGSSQFTVSTRGIVEELLDLYTKDRSALVAQVNQWKLFKKQQWKQQILPCCLDVGYWVNVFEFRPSADDDDTDYLKRVQIKKRVTELVSFVQVLAKHHAVGTQEYVGFIENVETWLKEQQGADKNGAQTNPRRHQHGDTGVLLKEALDSFFEQSTESVSARIVDQAWNGVAEAFTHAFEELAGLRPSDQDAHIVVIWDLVVWQCAVSAAEGDTSAVEACVEQHLKLWFTLLSSDATSGATPEERQQAMEAYCRVAVQRVGETTSVEGGAKEYQAQLVAFALTGTLMGLLASLTMCESIAVTGTLAMSAYLTGSKTETGVDVGILEVRKTSAFVSGFLTGFMKNPTDNAPQLLLQSVLPASLRESLVWVGHFTRVWWMDEFQSEASPGSDQLWRFVGRTLQTIYDQHAWFRLTFSPGVLTTKAEWRAFFERELMCCALELLSSSSPVVDLVPFVSVQREQIHQSLFSSSAGRSAGVHIADVCEWITRVTLALAASSPPAQHSASALDALVLLLRDVSSMHPAVQDSTPAGPTDSDPLGFVVATVASSAVKSREGEHILMRYSLRCVQVILDSSSLTKTSQRVSPQLIKTFFDRVAEAMESTATTVPFEWICSLWCIATRLSQCSEVVASAIDVPPSIFAHWAFEFGRLCRFLQPKKNGKAACASHLSLLKAVQTCYDFYRTLGVRRLQPQTTSMSLIGLSASQYVPSSVAEESLQLHVRSLEWLVRRDLLPTRLVLPRVVGLFIPDLRTSLAFHETATRVLTALLEDLALGRPDDVATELTESCQASWLASVSTEARKRHSGRQDDQDSSFKFQLLLVHMVAELAARHASVGRFLLRSSSELLEDPHRGFFVFLLLLISSETEHIDSILAHNGSLWVNTFAEVACSLADISVTPSQHTAAATPSSIVALLQPSTGFQSQLSNVMARVLDFAASRQIDLLDTAVLTRMGTLFPTLAGLLARVPVLNLASAAYFTGDF